MGALVVAYLFIVILLYFNISIDTKSNKNFIIIWYNYKGNPKFYKVMIRKWKN